LDEVGIQKRNKIQQIQHLKKGKQWAVEMSEECPLFGTFGNLKKRSKNGKGNA
jgi:hypothetical protein